MDFKEQQQQLIAQLQRGDKKAISERAQVSTVTLWSALNKNSIAEMTEYEKRAWVAAVEHINEKQDKNDEIKLLTSNVSERI